MGAVTLRGVSKTFGKENGAPLDALKEIDLEIRDKEFICLLGPSGCGKTTLLRILAGLEVATGGEVLLDGTPLREPNPKVGMVFQEYSLFPWRTVLGNIAFGPEMRGVPRSERIPIAERYLALVGLEPFRDSYPSELSGGMRQRIAIARALANEPEVLLMDEPFGALDAQTRNRMQKELLQIHEKMQKTIVFVTHSVDEAVYLADRIVVLTKRPGRVKEIVNVIHCRPRDRTCADFTATRKHVLDLITEESAAIQ
ncbi:MAG: ABC transporter ATP-binding protein [Methanomicrobiales archaeon]|nr:ABC transporter ATP-binding protein [Methanomicrobiales archaeon]MDI6875685.1 ABC transporter ATP-binding protein [Methanomicrobiales archaeon]